MPTAKRFEDLEVWQDSRELVKRVYQLTESFPKHEIWGLCSQIRRAAVSTMSNVAEGFERGTKAEFIQFLYTARASCGEVRSQSYIALDLGYGREPEVQHIQKLCVRLSKRLQTLIEYLKHSEYKGAKLQETGTDYSIQQPET